MKRITKQFGAVTLETDANGEWWSNIVDRNGEVLLELDSPFGLDGTSPDLYNDVRSADVRSAYAWATAENREVALERKRLELAGANVPMADAPVAGAPVANAPEWQEWQKDYFNTRGV